MKINYYYLLLLALFVASCSEQPPLSGTIEITPTGDWASKVYLIQPTNFDGIASSYEGIVLDSARIETNGNFVFKEMPNAPEEMLLQLAIQKKEARFFNKLENEDMETANYFPLVWKNGNSINISAQADHFQNSFSIKNPSPPNAAMLHLRDIRWEAFQKYFSKKDTEAPDENQIIAQADALMNFRQPLIKFATDSPDLLPALVAIRWVSIEDDYERVPEFLFAQCQKWQTSLPDHPWVIQLCEKGNRKILPVMIGDKLPDVPMPMLSGDTIPLQQLLHQRLTLLDLWASWCAPCRRENRDYLVPIWDKYQEADFQIIGYALDAGERSWKAAIKKDGADRWLHASHLQGDDSPLFNQLHLKTIPANFLIDKTGKVIAKNLHGEELRKFVDEFMNQ